MNAAMDKPVLTSGFIAISRVMQTWRIWFSVSLFFVVVGTAIVLPAYGDLRAALDRLPTARGEFGTMLLGEVERLRPGTRPSIDAWGLLATLCWIFAAGGAATIGGVVDRRERVRPRAISVAAFLGQGGRYFFRSLRTWLIFILLVLLWAWAWRDVAVPFLEERYVLGGDERMQFRYDVIRDVVFAIGVFKLWMLRRLAMGFLVVHERRSALRAWLSALGFLFFHPIRSFFGFGVVAAFGAAALVALSFALRFAGERLWAEVLVALAIVFVYQLTLLAAYAVARLLIESDQPVEFVRTKDPLLLDVPA